MRDDLATALAAAERQATELATDFVAQALALVGMELGTAGLHCSPLLGVEERMEFGERVLPEAVRRAREGQDASEIRVWLKARIGAWGGDGIGLTAPGYTRWKAELDDPCVVAVLDDVFRG